MPSIPTPLVVVLCILLLILVALGILVAITNDKHPDKQRRQKSQDNSGGGRKFQLSLSLNWIPIPRSWVGFWKFLLGCVGLMLVIVLGEELFFDRDYRPERVTLPIGYERYIEETVRDGQESAIYLIPRASGNRWWQSCFEDLNGNQLPDEVIVPVNQRVVNGRTVADGVMIRNNTGGLVSFRAWRVSNNRHGPTRC